MSEPHYVIKAKRGWKPLLPPMAPAPEHPKWWHFGQSASFDALFIGGDGKDMRITGNWYHTENGRRSS